MSSPPEAIAGHLALLEKRLGDKALPFSNALAENDWDVQRALDATKAKVPEGDYLEIDFVYHVAVIFNNDEQFFGLLGDRKVHAIQQLAMGNLEELIPPDFQPQHGARNVFYEAAWARLFELRPRQVIIAALETSRIQAATLQQPIVQALQSLKDWDMLTEPIRETNQMGMLEADFTTKRWETMLPAVIQWLERLQRTLALTRSHTVEATSAVLDLMNSGFDSASIIAGTPAETFILELTNTQHPQSTWLAIHNRAISIQECNLCVVNALYNTAKGSGMAVLDGPMTPVDRLETINKAAGSAFRSVNLSTLFQDLESESCDECNSVNSPAAYFVELLQFLRNNNVQAGHAGLYAAVAGTTLGRLFARRPDLGDLQLTCANTTVVMPYLDLANEAMESYIVRNKVDVYNTGASSSEAMAEPEHTNIEAYRILSTSLCPFTKLPYHQALDEVRTFLKYLKTSRHEILGTLSQPSTAGTQVAVLARAMTSEYLNITPEEYIAIAWEPNSSEQESQYWGYKRWLYEMQYMQFQNKLYGGVLEKSGLSMLELVELLQTTYINPNITAGNAIVIILDEHDIGKFVLRYLNQADLLIQDWTRFRRFTQLWRKTGWRMSEVDQAISGLGGPKDVSGIGTDLLPQIAAVMKLVELMGLEVEVLLTFWTPLVTNAKSESLYTRLFLSHHIVSIDPVFMADIYGRFLQPSKDMEISKHVTVLEATLGLTKEGLDAVKATIQPMSGNNLLSIGNVSTLYRHAVLAKFLGATTEVLFQAIELFNIDPFASATRCLQFVERWQEMETAGFSFAQLLYGLTGTDDPLRPLGPSKVALERAIEQIQKSIADLSDTVDGLTMGQEPEQSGIRGWLKKEKTSPTAVDSLSANSGGNDSVIAPHLTYDLMYSTLSTVTGISVDILRVLLPDIPLRIPDAEMIVPLARAAIFINGFKLGVAEVEFVGSVLPEFPHHELSLLDWTNLLAYVQLRDSLPKPADAHYYPLLEMLVGSPTTETTASLTPQIAELLLVKPDVVAELLSHFQLTSVAGERGVAFSRANRVVSTLTKLKKAIGLADRIGTEVKRLITWSKPTSDFMEIHVIASDIRAMMRGRTRTEDWENTIKPLRNQIRDNQRQALVASLVLNRTLMEWGVVGEDSLFEYFLIDVKMGACLETSRIKQAISTIQLFIHRCFYGLEEGYGVKSSDLNRERWEWMKHYRTWEANRMVFLYPENWVDPSLRDDKSPFFIEFESDLIQRDLNRQNIEESVQNYISRMDEVANLRELSVIGYDGTSTPQAYHFARTQSTPFVYYQQTYERARREWKPWQVMPLDIQTHEDHKVMEDLRLTYVPVLFQQRLHVFTPLLVKKTVQIGKATANTVLRTEDRVEIRLGWSEYRNNKWTAKQLSGGTWLSPPALFTHFYFHFRYPSATVLAIHAMISPPGAQLKDYPMFKFSNGVLEAEPSAPLTLQRAASVAPVDTIEVPEPAALAAAAALAVVGGGPVALRSTDIATTQSTDLPASEAHSDPIKPLADLYNSLSSKLLEHPTTATTAPSALRSVYKTLAANTKAISSHELRERNSLYPWELGLHIPMLLMDRLASSHQYEQALEVAHYVFDPMHASATNPNVVWKWEPFQKQATIADSIRSILGRLLGNTPAPDVENWRNRPFQPHVVARDRPVAYKRWMVVRYIEILIASGDKLFRENTMESIPLAIQYYMLASHLYGPPGMTIPGCRQKKNPKTYNSLLTGWDAFSNAFVDLENAFPFHRPSICFCGKPTHDFNLAWNRYFCVPRNKRLRDLRATIDDRLYKIRHCLDINGAKLVRALFEPPIDPGVLVRATAEGLSIANVLDHAGGPMPNYRFRYLLQKAFEMVQELKSLGSEFLAAKEKKDSHAYELIRVGHEHSINTLVMDMKKLNLVESNKTLDALKKSRDGPFARLNHYSQLVGEDIKQFASMRSFSEQMPAFKPIEAGIEAPLSEDKLKLTTEEKSEITNAASATTLRISSKRTDAIATALLIIPQFSIAAQPFGIGISTELGTRMVAESLRATAFGMSAGADGLDGSSVHAGRKATLIRQFQERVQQANSAGYELEVLDAQIAAHLSRISVAEKDIQLQEKQIENALATESFLRTMYTSTELYSWQEKQLRGLYYQAYTVAYDLAQKVERTFNYERGQTGSGQYIKASWDANKDGLFSGEALGLGLRQLEAVYQNTRGHDFEITKHVSLRQLDPMAVLHLQETNTCAIKLPEVLFDLDFPGHYNRRLKSVSLSLPCVVGPYSSTNCTLQLDNYQYRPLSSSALIKSAAPPITRIAVSNGLHDTGVFELNFNDERYLPFEGAGAISDWTLTLPEFAAFDYRTVTDAILHLKYTSMSGNPKQAQEAVAAYLQGSQTVLFDLPNEIATAWHQRGNEQPMALHNLAARLPWRHQGKAIKVTAIQLLTTGYPDITPSAFRMTEVGENQVVFSGATAVGRLQSFTGKITSWQGEQLVEGFKNLKLMVKRGAELKDLWMLVKYTAT